MKKTKILYIIRRAEGGMKKHLLILLNMLSKDKYELAVGCSFDKKTEKDLKNIGIKIYHIDISDGLKLTADWKTVRSIKLVIDDFKPDIVHLHGAKASLIGRLACIKKKVKIVTTIHNFPDYNKMNYLKRYIYLKLNKYLNKKTSKIITVSNALKDEIIKNENVDEKKIVTIYNCLDFPLYSNIKHENLREKYDLDDDTLIVGCISRLIPSKGIKDLIEAAKILDKDINIYYFIIGDGPLRGYLENLTNGLNLKNVIFLGYRNDIQNILQNIDIFVLPSYIEGFGISIIEAMYAGKPVIATNVGGIPEIIKNNINGILINPGSPNDMANAIRALAIDSSTRERLSAAGRDLVTNKFTCEKMINDISNVYEEVKGR